MRIDREDRERLAFDHTGRSQRAMPESGHPAVGLGERERPGVPAIDEADAIWKKKSALH